MRKIGYLALCLYLLLVALIAIIPNLLIPSMLLAVLALIASFGIFLDICDSHKKEMIQKKEAKIGARYPSAA